MPNVFQFLIAFTVILFTFDLQAQSFEDGQNAERDGNYKAAFNIWLPLSQNGDPLAQTGHAFLYKNDRAYTRPDQAIILFKKAAAKGNATAQNILGLFHYSGNGVEQDFSKAAKYYLMAAEQGDADSQFMLASLYQRGEGVEQNNAEAARWFKAAAIQGDKIALSSLMGLHSNELNVGKNFQSGSKIIKDLSKQLMQTHNFVSGSSITKAEASFKTFYLPRNFINRQLKGAIKMLNLG